MIPVFRCACGGGCPRCKARKNPPGIGPELEISRPEDSSEREANRTADLVMRSRPEAPVQRRKADEELEENDEIRMKPAADVAGYGAGLDAGPRGLEGGGRPLPSNLRGFFEPRFGRGFGEVRIHTDEKAAAVSRSIRAHAFTYGRNIAFGSGEYAPHTLEGRHLIAHELAHVVQQGGTADRRLQRLAACEPPESCPPRVAGEQRRARRSQMLVGGVSNGVSGLVIGNFAIGEAATKPDLLGNQTWRDFLLQMAASSNLRWEILGYTDCTGSETVNRDLRQRGADAVFSLLPAQMRARVQGAASAPLEDCVAGSASENDRALNRSALIRLVSTEIAFEPEEADTISVNSCGPEVTAWLIAQMQANQNHPVIRTGREHRWARWIPLFNVGWTIAAFKDFADLVAPGKPWDFKRTQGWWRASAGGPCPAADCDRTVTLCGRCVNYDVPGNIHFGWVGRRMEIAPWALHAGAGGVQEGGAVGDDPPDTVAINIGIAMADDGKYLCDEVNSNLSRLNLDRTKNCFACGGGEWR